MKERTGLKKTFLCMTAILSCILICSCGTTNNTDSKTEVSVSSTVQEEKTAEKSSKEDSTEKTKADSTEKTKADSTEKTKADSTKEDAPEPEPTETPEPESEAALAEFSEEDGITMWLGESEFEGLNVLAGTDMSNEITLIFTNETEDTFRIGQEDNCEVFYITTEGTYSSSAPPMIVEPDSMRSMNFLFLDAEGELLSVYCPAVAVVDDQGQKAEKSEGSLDIPMQEYFQTYEELGMDPPAEEPDTEEITEEDIAEDMEEAGGFPLQYTQEAVTEFLGMTFIADVAQNGFVGITIINPTDKLYSIGWIDSAVFTAETTTGTYTDNPGFGVEILPGKQSSFFCEFDTEGRFLSLTIPDIREMLDEMTPGDAPGETLVIRFP